MLLMSQHLFSRLFDRHGFSFFERSGTPCAERLNCNVRWKCLVFERAEAIEFFQQKDFVR